MGQELSPTHTAALLGLGEHSRSGVLRHMLHPNGFPCTSPVSYTPPARPLHVCPLHAPSMSPAPCTPPARLSPARPLHARWLQADATLLGTFPSCTPLPPGSDTRRANSPGLGVRRLRGSAASLRVLVQLTSARPQHGSLKIITGPTRYLTRLVSREFCRADFLCSLTTPQLKVSQSHFLPKYLCSQVFIGFSVRNKIL